MILPPWHEEPVSTKHHREGFDCGEKALDDYLKYHARKNHDRGASKTIVAVPDNDPLSVLGYYTLSPVSVCYARVPETARRGLGPYDVAGFRLGRLAVARSVQGLGLGGQLLLSAAHRCILASCEVGGTMLLIDAKNKRASCWYESYGAVPLQDTPLSLILPLAVITPLLSDKEQRQKPLPSGS